MEDIEATKIRELFSKGVEMRYQKGEVILRSGDIPQGVYYVVKGNVKMDVIFENGKELTINIFKPGSYFPAMWAISNIFNNNNFISINEVTLRRLSRDDFLRILDKDPRVLMEFTKRLLVGLSGLITNIEYLLFGNAYSRIVAAIILIAKRFGNSLDKTGNKILITIPLTHQDLANLTAITRESASIVIGKLKKQNLISVKTKLLVVNDLQRLTKESEVEVQEDGKSISL